MPLLSLLLITRRNARDGMMVARAILFAYFITIVHKTGTQVSGSSSMYSLSMQFVGVGEKGTGHTLELMVYGHENR